MHPVLFHLFGLTISPYGLLLSVGLLSGVFFAVLRARQVGVKEEVIMDVAFLGTLSGFAGGRIVFILTHLSQFKADPMGMLLDRAGFTFLGGLILGTLVSLFIIHRRKEAYFAVGDVVAPSLSLAHFFGRIGCFFAGCCYGKVCPTGYENLGVRFPAYADHGELIPPPALADHIDQGLVPHSAHESLAVWPTQIYESLGNLLIFFFLMWLWRRRKFQGQIFVSYLAAYSLLRFGVEFFRGDVDRGLLFSVSTSQWLSVAILLLAGGLWAFLRRRKLVAAPKEEATLMAAEAEEGAEEGTDAGEGSGAKRRRKKR